MELRLTSWLLLGCLVLAYRSGSEAASHDRRSRRRSSDSNPTCTETVPNLHLSSPPYDNYFLSDCHSATQVVVTSPLAGSDLDRIGPRVIVAWPAGNSGAVVYFEPSNGGKGTLGIRLVNSTIGQPLGPIYEPAPDDATNRNANYGISTHIEFNSSAKLTVAILGSIRHLRDYTEGGGILRPEIQSTLHYDALPRGGVSLSRLWLDNTTTSIVSLTPTSQETVTVDNMTVTLDAGTYVLNASFNYPQLKGLSPQDVLKDESSELIAQQPQKVQSLAFLSYDSKLLAGGWRFLTYFGRDSMIAALLLQPVLSQGKGGAFEAVIAAVLERVNGKDGTVCHEETIGDYATWQNLHDGKASTAPQCDYKMIDSDYFLPVLMDQYFVKTPNGSSRVSEFFKTTVSFFPNEGNRTYADMAKLTLQKLMKLAAPFAAKDGQTKDNLMHLNEGIGVGQWRDSGNGLGGGRIPFDVNVALMPAALRAIGSLARAGVFPGEESWGTEADQHASVWEDSTSQFFDVSIPESEAKSRLATYAKASSFPGPDQASTLDGGVDFPALSLDGNNDQSKVEVMHTDTAFRLFLVNGTNDAQLSKFINDTAKSVLRPFPAGLLTDVGLLVANPAFGMGDSYVSGFTTRDYHGTVVWSWQLAMMAHGLELQLDRCSSSEKPAFCNDAVIMCNAKTAYTKLWDAIEANKDHLTTEVWSWTYRDGKFQYIDLGELSSTESNIVQLWSLTFLAVTRNAKFSGSC